MAPPVAPVLLEKVEESMSTCAEYHLQEVSDNLTAFSFDWPAYIDVQELNRFRLDWEVERQR